MRMLDPKEESRLSWEDRNRRATSTSVKGSWEMEMEAEAEAETLGLLRSSVTESTAVMGGGEEAFFVNFNDH